MLRKFVCAVVIVGLGIGLAAAEELKGRITKIEGTKITFQAMEGKDKKGEAKVYDLAPTAKVTSGKDNKEVVGGLKSAQLSKISDKGVAATINVDGGKVTSINLSGGGTKKKKDAK